MTFRFPSFKNHSVLVVGDLMLDRYWHGGTARISPEAPVPVVHVTEIEERPGGAANVALNVASLGSRSYLLGIVGNDEAGHQLERLLNRANVACHFVRRDDAPTITKLRVISRQQQLIRLDFEEPFTHVADHELLAQYTELLSKVDVVILSDYGKGVLRQVKELIALARQHQKRVLIDPKGKDFSIYSNASIITPNMSEFETIVGACHNEQEIEGKGRALAQQLNLAALLVTRGEHGMTLLEQGKPAVHIPTQAREVYDVTGAGDTVISVLGAALACGETMVDSTSLANIAAGIVVGKLGTATVTESELRVALKGHQEHDQGVLDEDALVAAVADAKARGERIVMTNGCFDILHAGHVSYLESARHLGDRLIVAVNDDDSVKRLKGASRPINPLEQRMAVLAGLASVDWVVPFSEDTPERLICRAKPDVLVKGGDYRAQEVAGYDCVTKNGGRVEILHFVDGCSTSSIIEKAKKTSA